VGKRRPLRPIGIPEHAAVEDDRPYRKRYRGRGDEAEMNNPYLNTANWTAMSTATGFGIGFIITVLAACLLYKAFPRFRRPEVFFWVMLGILMVTSLGSMLILTPLQVHNGKQAAHVP